MKIDVQRESEIDEKQSIHLTWQRRIIPYIFSISIVVTHFWVPKKLMNEKLKIQKNTYKNIYSEGIQKNSRSEKATLECP
jgi:hypothetical protein